MTIDRRVAVRGATPYPWPWNGDLRGTGTAVLVVSPSDGGPAPSQDCAAAMQSVCGAVRGAGGLVVEVITRPRGRSAVAHQRHGEASLAAVLCIEAVSVRSAGIDGFWGSSLEDLLRRSGIERIVLVGAGLETCVHSTMRSANDRGFECLLAIDACAAHDPSLIPAAVSMIEMSGGIFGAVGRGSDIAEAFGGPAA